MKIRTITSWGLAVLALSAQVTQAQNLEDLVQRLVRQTDTLAQRSYDSFSSRRNPSRYDIEALYQSRSLNASAELFQRMVRDRRSDSELRDSFAVLQDLFRNSGRYAFDRRYWSDIQRTSDDLARELKSASGIPMTVVRLGTIKTAALPDGCAGAAKSMEKPSFWCVVPRWNREPCPACLPVALTFNFTSPLPRRAADVRLEKKQAEGRSKSSNSLRETTISRPWLRFETRKAEQMTTNLS